MNTLRDSLSDLPLSPPLEIDPFSPLPSHQDVKEGASALILSASGWRGLFVADNDPQNRAEIPSPSQKVLMLAMSSAFILLLNEQGIRSPSLTVAIDTRFTGPALADVALRTLLSQGVIVNYLFIAPIPEVIAYTKAQSSLEGFLYLSASHNPIGYNGVKFGRKVGGVINPQENARARTLFSEIISSGETLFSLVEQARTLPSSLLKEVYRCIPVHKRLSHHHYRLHADLFMSHGNHAEGENLASSLRQHACGVVGELNGSARTVSIDRQFLSAWGSPTIFLNDTPRQIVHEILPEGVSLLPCQKALEALHAQDPRFLLGYVPDNDGDRGNLVYYDTTRRQAERLAPQETLAITLLSELLTARSRGNPSPKEAVIINGPTSLRIERIASFFGVSTFRVEVGEAHLLALESALKQKGWHIYLMGEGSNGGTIVPPSSVRDPLGTLSAFLKILSLASHDKTCFLTLWPFAGKGTKGGALATLRASLPVFTTTGANEAHATVPLGYEKGFKERYLALFSRQWKEKRGSLLSRFGFCSWEAYTTCGTTFARYKGDSLVEEGGLTIRFLDRGGVPIAFLWMRTSGTEPLLRLIVDLEGNSPEGETFLLSWHRQMIKEAKKG